MERIIADKDTKFIGIVLFVSVVISILFAFYKFIIVNDYKITSYIDCDSQTESCFSHICDSELGEECTGDILSDTWYYKIATTNANEINICNDNEKCDNSLCGIGNTKCEIIYCDASEDEECIN